jgi:hypothetical protein
MLFNRDNRDDIRGSRKQIDTSLLSQKAVIVNGKWGKGHSMHIEVATDMKTCEVWLDNIGSERADFFVEQETVALGESDARVMIRDNFEFLMGNMRHTQLDERLIEAVCIGRLQKDNEDKAVDTYFDCFLGVICACWAQTD